MKKRKFSTIIKQNLRKLKYLDKTHRNYFMTMSFLLGFCLFTGVTYSYFTFSKYLNATTITIARLNYTLSSPTTEYVNGNVTVPAGEKIVVDLNLTSQNKTNTKYALKYDTTSTGVKVYYSENYQNNMAGVIGPQGSIITMRVIIVNESSVSSTVGLTVSGGYLQNTLETNITEGYFEDDIIIRSVLLEESLTNGIIGKSFPPQDGDYTYYKTECSGNATAKWNDEEWKLELDDITSRTSCDVYFKKIKDDIEIYFALEKDDGTIEYTTAVPNDGTYNFDRVTCNTDVTATWDIENWKMDVSNIQKKTICTGYFKEIQEEILEFILVNPLADISTSSGSTFIPKYKVKIMNTYEKDVTLDIITTMNLDDSIWTNSSTENMTTTKATISAGEEQEIDIEFPSITLKEELATLTGMYTYTIPCTLTIPEPSNPETVKTETFEFNLVYQNTPPSSTKYQLTIDYYFADGSKAHASYVNNYDNGAVFSVISPTIDGYQPDIKEVKGKITQNTKIEVTYTATYPEIPE